MKKRLFIFKDIHIAVFCRNIESAWRPIAVLASFTDGLCVEETPELDVTV